MLKRLCAFTAVVLLVSCSNDSKNTTSTDATMRIVCSCGAWIETEFEKKVVSGAQQSDTYKNTPDASRFFKKHLSSCGIRKEGEPDREWLKMLPPGSSEYRNLKEENRERTDLQQESSQPLPGS